MAGAFAPAIGDHGGRYPVLRKCWYLSLFVYRRKGTHGKIKDFIRWLGEKLFPDLPENKRQRITVQIIIGISLALICMAGMGIFRYKAVRQLEKYQAIADAYAQLDIILEEEREKSQKEAAVELEELFSEMEADAERYRQEYEAEMRELGLEAYDWDALCSENEDIKGWLCIPGTLINFPVVGTDDNAFTSPMISQGIRAAPDALSWIRTRRYGILTASSTDTTWVPARMPCSPPCLSMSRKIILRRIRLSILQMLMEVPPPIR